MSSLYFVFSFSGDQEVASEEGEVKEEELHPLVTVSNINPEDIPDVPINKFLMRGVSSRDKKDNRKRGWKLYLCI